MNKFPKRIKVLTLLIVIFLGFGQQARTSNALQESSVHFAIIGDYGYQGQPASDVAALVKSWAPEFIVTAGDNNYGGYIEGTSYPAGSAETIDTNIGQYYQEYIFPYAGAYGSGAASTNMFFPAMGNHDWDTTSGQAYFDYFTLPGNEKYYDFVQGPVHFFMVDSDAREPDGNTASSIQGQWLQNALANSTDPWNIVILHHAPYSSASHGSNTALQWPFQSWGADAVVAGHDHSYERIMLNGFPYFVNGLGGRSIYNFGTPVSGSTVRYNGNYGAMLVAATTTTLSFQFIDISQTVIDAYTIDKNKTVVFMSKATQDGFIVESTSSSSKGGIADSSGIRVGDETENQNIQSILSFNTSSLPDSAIIKSVTLAVKKSEGVGNSPYGVLGGILVDIRIPYFGGGPGLAINDWQTSASLLSIANGVNITYNRHVFTLSSTAFAFINKTGITQFKLRTALQDNNNYQADYLQFYAGEAATSSNRPKLTIGYFLP